MSKDAMLPCIGCGLVLRNVVEDVVNQPEEGTEFQTYGHYGSTFWDSFSGEEIIINVCDGCLRTWPERVARRKMFRKLVVWDYSGSIKAMTVVGREWVYREMVPYFDGPEDDDEIGIEISEIGVLDRRDHGHYENIEWVRNWREIKARLMAQQLVDDGQDGTCKHARFVAECLDCGATPLEGLR